MALFIDDISWESYSFIISTLFLVSITQSSFIVCSSPKLMGRFELRIGKTVALTMSNIGRIYPNLRL